jgi:TolA-binding protein
VISIFSFTPTISDVLTNIDKIGAKADFRIPVLSIFLAASIFMFLTSIVFLFIQRSQINKKEENIAKLKNENSSFKDAVITSRAKICDLEIQLENFNSRVHQLKTENEKLQYNLESLLAAEKERSFAVVEDEKKPRRLLRRNIQKVQEGVPLFSV